MKWINIQEKLPELDKTVWLYDKNNNWIYIGVRIHVINEGWLWARSYDGVYIEENEIKADAHFDDIQPTHWHPFPKVPNK